MTKYNYGKDKGPGQGQNPYDKDQNKKPGEKGYSQDKSKYPYDEENKKY